MQTTRSGQIMKLWQPPCCSDALKIDRRWPKCHIATPQSVTADYLKHRGPSIEPHPGTHAGGWRRAWRRVEVQTAIARSQSPFPLLTIEEEYGAKTGASPDELTRAERVSRAPVFHSLPHFSAFRGAPRIARWTSPPFSAGEASPILGPRDLTVAVLMPECPAS